MIPQIAIGHQGSSKLATVCLPVCTTIHHHNNLRLINPSLPTQLLSTRACCGKKTDCQRLSSVIILFITLLFSGPDLICGAASNHCWTASTEVRVHAVLNLAQMWSLLHQNCACGVTIVYHSVSFVVITWVAPRHYQNKHSLDNNINFLLLTRYVPNVAKEEYMRSV